MQNENFKNETFTIVDTKALQIKSLLDFAEALGWVPVNRTRLSRGFKAYVKTCYDYISLENMIWEYNQSSKRPYGKLFDIKLVQQVKLQRDKSKPDGVKCQNHMVRLTPRGEELYSHLRSL